MIEFFIENGRYVVLDRKTMTRIEMDRGGMKALARFLMVELNVVEFSIREAENVFHVHDEKFEELLKKRWRK